MKKSLLFILFVFLSSSLLAQNNWKTINSIAGELTQFKPGKMLNNGQTIWLCGTKDYTPNKCNSYRSTDGGATWLKSPDISDGTTTAVRMGQIDAKDANIAITGLTNGKLVKTTDGGATWKVVHSYVSEGDEWFDAVYFMDDNNVIALGDCATAGQYYIAKSSDAGETFTQIPYANLPSAGGAHYGYFTYGSCSDKIANTIWFVLYESSTKPSTIIKTTDAGATWTATVLTIPTVRINGISFTDLNNGMCIDNAYKLYKTTDGGATWAAITAPTPDVNGTFTIRGVSGIKGANKMLVLGWIEGTGLNKMAACFSTTDMGTTWVKENIPISPLVTGSTKSYLCGAVMKDANTGVLYGADGVIYQTGVPAVTKNALLAEEVKFNGVIAKGLVFKPGKILDNGNTIWLCGHETTGDRNTYPFLSTDGGTTFSQGGMLPKRVANIDAYSKTIALAATAEGKIFKTTDGGKTWVEKHSYKLDGDLQFFDGIKIINDSVVIAIGDGANNGEMYFCKSTNKGETFTVIPASSMPSLGTNMYAYFAYGTCMASYGDNIWCSIYGGTDNGRLLKSTNAGTTWTTTLLSMATVRFNSIAINNAKYGIGIDNTNKDLFITTDGGTGWTKTAAKPTVATGTLTLYSVAGIPESKTFYALGVIVNGANRTNAIIQSIDLGVTWTQIAATPAATSEYVISGLLLNENFGYFLTNAGYALKLGNGTPTYVDNPLSNIPRAFRLEQNYPNPFNPSTMIRFNLDQSDNVRLVVYDALGREIETLINDRLSAGTHEYRLNASHYSSGVYYYSLICGSKVETKKMVLMK